MDFVAIDFETANSSRDSACSLGAVAVENGRITQRKYTLINPKVEFQEFCTYIHGITQDAVESSPSFEEIYPALYKMLDNKFVVAHNASFDVAVLKESCASRNLPMPKINPFCSVEMARKAWSHLPHHKLNYLCDYFKLPLKHHNAIEDSTACAMLVLMCAKELEAKNISELNILLNKKAQEEKRLIALQKQG